MLLGGRAELSFEWGGVSEVEGAGHRSDVWLLEALG